MKTVATPIPVFSSRYRWPVCAVLPGLAGKFGIFPHGKDYIFALRKNSKWNKNAHSIPRATCMHDDVQFMFERQ
ncbi:hypothetical protein [Polaromonas sp.]|uniref:hypothetical protein n=1 Tax=Polaromonas sp. TaxID=1869339 RepID=UPI0017952408|nr:hypothetical protein [Polaromonas sp.]NML85098.1 hypothetical protein [Polaromonas sp.]